MIAQKLYFPSQLTFTTKHLFHVIKPWPRIFRLYTWYWNAWVVDVKRLWQLIFTLFSNSVSPRNSFRLACLISQKYTSMKLSWNNPGWSATCTQCFFRHESADPLHRRAMSIRRKCKTPRVSSVSYFSFLLSILSIYVMSCQSLGCK